MFDVKAWPPDRVKPAEVQKELDHTKFLAGSAAAIVAVLILVGGNLLGSVFGGDDKEPPVPTVDQTQFCVTHPGHGTCR